MSFDADHLRASLQDCSGEQLCDIIVQQAHLIADLQAQIQALNERLEDLEQRPPRVVAPFRRDDKDRTSTPKSPGRQPGHKGNFRCPLPPTEHLEVALPACPSCGATLSQRQPCVQLIEELPVVQPRVIQLTTYKALCPNCGTVRSTHPLQVSTAVGAAGAHLGPQALRVAIELQHRWHLSKRKTCDLLSALFGLRLSPGGLVHAAQRLAQALRPRYEDLQSALQGADFAHIDETSWYVGRVGYWLWVVCDPQTTLYHINASRARRIAQQLLGTDYPGVLISDCLSVYDNLCQRQHKCYAHHLKEIAKAMEKHPQGEQASYLKDWRLLLQTAMAVKELQAEVQGVAYANFCQRLHQRAARLLAAPRGQPQEETIRLRLLKQQDHLFEFLHHEGVEATNNLAERQLRPAVMARKVSCGNRTERGAQSWEVLASLAATCAQRGESFAQWLSETLCLLPQSVPIR